MIYPIILSMLTLQQFAQLSYKEKKEMLITICGQLDTPHTSFENVIFLLNASDRIKETTLDTIYADLGKTLDKARETVYLEQKSQYIQELIQHDMQTQQEHKQADMLLDTIQ